MNACYTADTVRAAVEIDFEKLFASYSQGRPSNWSTDKRTKELVSIGNWLSERLTELGIDERGRQVQVWQYNRRSSSVEDLFALAAEIMNDTLADRIDRFRKPHRRWG